MPQIAGLDAAPAHPFPLLEDVIVLADAAMRVRDPARIVARLMASLKDVIACAGALPADVLAAPDGGYARREVYRSPAHGYQVLLLTWGPGHASTIHDHGDIWGVEAVLRGQLEVSDYAVGRRDGPLVELRPRGQHDLDDGRVIGLLPPHDLHLCRNPRSRGTAVSLHLYGRPLDEVRRNVPAGDGWYRPEHVRLSTVGDRVL